MRRYDGYQDDENNLDDDYEDVPLHHKRAFGAGLKRTRVEFVPAKEPDAGIATAAAKPAKPAVNIGDLYASVVLKDAASSSNTPETEGPASAKEDEPPICEICSLPVTDSSHEASLAHQVSLAHSHPPSALDRSRMGLRALKAQGWDPDARRGLGREGEGMRYPIKVAAKEDTLGIGAKAPAGVQKREEKPKKKLNAKEMKRLAELERRRGERLQRELFGSVDVERYLRGDGKS